MVIPMCDAEGTAKEECRPLWVHSSHPFHAYGERGLTFKFGDLRAQIRSKPEDKPVDVMSAFRSTSEEMAGFRLQPLPLD